MKILLITRYYPPLQGIATERMFSWAKYFRRLGHKTTVLTTEKKKSVSQEDVIEVPYFDPISFLGGDQIKQGLSKRNSSMINFYRTRMNERLPGRTDPWIIPAVRELKNHSGFDLIISSYGPPSAHIVGYFAKKRFGGLWFADFRDLWVDNHHYKGVWPFTCLERWCERKVCGRANALLTVSNGLKETLKAKFPEKEVIVIPNGYDDESYLRVDGGYFNDRKSKFRLVYTGTIYEGKHCLDVLFSALKELSEGDGFSERFELLFFGNPSHHLLEKIAEYHLNGVVAYQGLLPSDKVKRVQFSADAFLQIHFEHNQSDGVLSGKVYEYLFANKPILGVGISKNCELGKLITRANAGLLCQSKEEIKKNLLALVEGRYIHKSEQGVIEQYSRKRQAEEIIAAAKEFSQRMMSLS